MSGMNRLSTLVFELKCKKWAQDIRLGQSTPLGRWYARGSTRDRTDNASDSTHDVFREDAANAENGIEMHERCNQVTNAFLHLQKLVQSQ